MQKKNLIYIIGGAAVVGYFLWMKKKQSSASIPQAALPVTPDQELAPSFVNQPTEAIKQTIQKVAKKVRSRKAALKRNAPQQIDEQSGLMSPTSALEASPISQMMQDITPSGPLSDIRQDLSVLPISQPLSAKTARQSARSTKQEVRASGGSAKQARQAARAVKKEARKARKVGELPVTF